MFNPKNQVSGWRKWNVAELTSTSMFHIASMPAPVGQFFFQDDKLMTCPTLPPTASIVDFVVWFWLGLGPWRCWSVSGCRWASVDLVSVVCQAPLAWVGCGRQIFSLLSTLNRRRSPSVKAEQPNHSDWMEVSKVNKKLTTGDTQIPSFQYTDVFTTACIFAVLGHPVFLFDYQT